MPVRGEVISFRYSSPKMASLYLQLEEKQKELERIIGIYCGVEDLQSIVEGLTTLPALAADDPPHTKRSMTRAFRDVMDDCRTDQEKGALFLKIIPLVPATIYSKVADIIIKGPNKTQYDWFPGKSQNSKKLRTKN